MFAENQLQATEGWITYSEVKKDDINAEGTCGEREYDELSRLRL